MPQLTPVTHGEFDTLPGLEDWRIVLNTIQATFFLASYPAGAALIGEVSAAAERAVHHPDIDLRYPGRLRIVLMTHETGGLTTLDVELVREISRLAAAAGATSEPTRAQAAEIAIDTMDADRIRGFWAAAFGYREQDGNLVDPLRIGPPVWFQQMDEPRTERSRFHIDIAVAHDVAEARVAAVIAAGGTLVSDRWARAFWVLADADGNEACICTWQDR
jgi:4a-hydroxytetrahydrobiopterin dehydratase